MQRVVAERLVYKFSRHLEARATIQPGETVLVESEKHGTLVIPTVMAMLIQPT